MGSWQHCGPFRHKHDLVDKDAVRFILEIDQQGTRYGRIVVFDINGAAEARYMFVQGQLVLLDSIGRQTDV